MSGDDDLRPLLRRSLFRVVKGGRHLEKPMKVAVNLKNGGNSVDGYDPLRQGWLVYALPENEFVAWVDGSFDGDRNLKEEFPEAVVLCSLKVSLSEYESARETL